MHGCVYARAETKLHFKRECFKHEENILQVFHQKRHALALHYDICYTYVLRVTACGFLVQERLSERKSSSACSFRLESGIPATDKHEYHGYCVRRAITPFSSAAEVCGVF